MTPDQKMTICPECGGSPLDDTGPHENDCLTNTMDMSDASAPEDAIRILRNIVDRFYIDAGELESAWQDKEAGKFWSRLARDLEHVAVKAEGYKP